MTRRHWFHCTQRDLGSQFVAKKRAPDMQGFKEPDVPRLCVCPHVYQCFAARLFMEGPVRVYRTAEPRRAVKAVGVWDAFLTGEHWLVPPAPMVLVETIAADVVLKIQGVTLAYHEWTRQNSNHRLKIAQLLMAAKVLDQSEYRRFKAMDKYLDGKEPEAFVYGLINEALKKFEDK